MSRAVRCFWIRVAAPVVVALLLAPGCTHNRHQAADAEPVLRARSPLAVHRLSVLLNDQPAMPEIAWCNGSGVMIDRDLVLTAAHVVGNAALIYIDDAPFEPDAVRTKWSNRQHFVNDWAVVKLARSPAGTPLPFADAPALEPGDSFVVGGYVNADDASIRIEGQCTVVAPPSTWRHESDQLLLYRGAGIGKYDDLSGMSGGPAAVWNPDAQRYELIGIHVGTLQVSFLGLRMRHLDVGVVHRVTACDIQAMLDGDTPD